MTTTTVNYDLIVFGVTWRTERHSIQSCLAQRWAQMLQFIGVIPDGVSQRDWRRL